MNREQSGHRCSFTFQFHAYTSPQVISRLTLLGVMKRALISMAIQECDGQHGFGVCQRLPKVRFCSPLRAILDHWRENEERGILTYIYGSFVMFLGELRREVSFINSVPTGFHHSAQGWWSEPDWRGAPTLGNRPQK